MERRNSARIPLVREVLLCCHSRGLVRGLIQNISNSGLFVETHSMAFTENENIDICFMSDDQERMDFHRVSAKVARVKGCGLGLSFDNTLPKDLTDEYLLNL